jgi:hypothetical protein
MTYADTRLGSIENGFKCVKADSGKGWASFKLDNTQEWRQEQLLERRACYDYRKKQRLEAEEQRQKRSLSEVERDKQYRQMLDELTLHPDDRADLIRRGFTHEQIELSLFKSIERYQQLRSRYSELLPGVTSLGSRLIISEAGYLCPIRNSDGLIVACQVRLRTLESSSNRYRWLSSNEQTLHLYPEGCEPTGELPLPVFKATGVPEGIALAEGVGSKPFLVSQRLNLLTIGAAGGQWASSQQQLRSALDKALIEVNKKEIIIFPDAGDILNPHVMSRWQRVIALLEEWEWLVRIGWWGQIDKTYPDIDELEDFSSIRYISPQEFLELSTSHQLPEWQQKALREWKKNRLFNADLKKSSLWCDWKKPASNSLFFGKAGLGRGKTTRLKSWVEAWKKEDVTGFICLGYRNTLLLQLCEQLNFYHLHEHSGLQFKSASNEGIALCLDSLWRLNPDDFDDKIIIIDEVKSVIKHLLHSPTVKNRDKILSLFAEAIQRSRQVICLDGLMADWCVDYIKSMAPDKQIITAENTYKGNKPLVNLLMGTIKEWENPATRTIKVNDRSPWLKFLLEQSEVPAICADSQVFIEALDDLFTQKGYKTLRIDSKTVPEPYVKEFLSNCNAYIEKHQPDVLLYTPSAESGVDVSITNYFTHHFGFFFGVLDIDGILQMLGRIRDDIPKFVWCKNFVNEGEKQGSKSSLPEQILSSILKLVNDDIFTSFPSVTESEAWLEKLISHLITRVSNSNTIDLRVSCLIKSIENYEKTNLRDCLKEALLESGYKVRACVLSSFEESGKQANEATKEVKLQNSRDIFNAKKIALSSLKTLKFDARWEERCKVIQAHIREQLPGIEDTSTWTVDFIYKIRYEDREFLSKCEMYWLFQHPEVAQQLSLERLHWMARRQRTFLGNFKSRWAKVHALHDMGFDSFLDTSKEWTNDTPEVIELLKLGKKHGNALGEHPGKLSPIQYLGKLLSLFGLSLKSRKEGKTKRIYSLNTVRLNDPTRIQVLKCIDARLSQNRPELDWEAAMNEANGVLPENPAQTESPQAIQPPAPPPQTVYITDGSGVSREITLSSQSESPLSENARLCLEALADLETPGHPTICNLEQLFELFASMEAVGQECEEELPSDFWSRVSTALGVVSESLEAMGIIEENPAQIEPDKASQPPAPAPQNVYISDGEGVSTDLEENPSESVLGKNTITGMNLAGLVERLRYAFNFKAFCRVISGWATEVIEDAIALQDEQPIRSKMSGWLSSASTG